MMKNKKLDTNSCFFCLWNSYFFYLWRKI